MIALLPRKILVGLLATFIALVSGTWQPAAATHFRYAHISWVRTGPLSVAFTVQAAFRRSAVPSFDECVNPTTGAVIACTGAGGLAAVGDVVREDIGDTRLNFGDGTEAYVSNPSNPSQHYLYFVVTSIDPTNNWFVGAALDPASLSPADTAIDHTYANAGPWTARIDTCCRIEASAAPNAHINNPDGNYRIESRVSLSTANNSPVSSFPPIVTCPQNGTCQFQILANDPDGDPIRFRLSTAAEASGNGVFRQPGPTNAPNAASISSSGLYTWNTTGATLASGSLNTLYSTQVSIEDLTAGSVVKSKVALDFFIQLVPLVNHPPTFSQPTCGSTLTVNTGVQLQFGIAASDQDAGDTVTLNASGVPPGADLLPILPTAGNPVSSQFTWTPALGDAGSHVVTFTATDQASQQALCAVTVDVNSTCGNSTVEPGEACDGGGCCTAGCQFATGECRPSAGECDAAETCTGTSADCPADLPASAGTTCGNPAASACDGADTCDGAGACQANLASSGASCGDAGTACVNQDTCDGLGACLDNGFAPSGTSCGSGPAGNASCDAADTCNGSGACETNVAPEGTPCGDSGTDCTNQDLCDGTGACLDNGIQPAGTPCGDDSNECTDDVCDDAGFCGVPNTAPCDDEDACTTGETCSGGQCLGGSPTICPQCQTCDPTSGGCIPGPRPTPEPPVLARPGLDCRTSASKKAKLVMKHKEPSTGDLLVWKWNKWADTPAGTFGNPATSETYTVCVFDDIENATPGLVYRVDVPPGGECSNGPCWKTLGVPDVPVGFKYLDKSGTSAGMVKMKLKSVEEKPARIGLRGKGDNLPDAALPLAAPVAVQLQTSAGECWGSVFETTGVLKNEDSIFKARSR